MDGSSYLGASRIDHRESYLPNINICLQVYIPLPAYKGTYVGVYRARHTELQQMVYLFIFFICSIKDF